MLDGSGVKAMPGLIPEPNPGSFNIRNERKYRYRSQMGTPKKKTIKKINKKTLKIIITE